VGGIEDCKFVVLGLNLGISRITNLVEGVVIVGLGGELGVVCVAVAG
jgi:hypothetical protein